MISVVCWKWNKEGYRSKFTAAHVNTLKNMVKRNLNVEHRFVCVTDDGAGLDPDVTVVNLPNNPCPDYGAADRPNCFLRLNAFSEWAKSTLGDRFMWIDLDVVITGDITPIVQQSTDFGIWCVDDERMPCNGSLVLHTAGTRPQLWDNFKPEEVHGFYGFRKLTGFVGSDQAWIAQNLQPDDYFFGKKDGVYSFRCHLKPRPFKTLPIDARMVFFHGPFDPSDKKLQSEYDWIAEHYQ